MSNLVAIHEPLMNESRFILPRVGVGVRGGVGVGVLVALATHLQTAPSASAMRAKTGSTC